VNHGAASSAAAAAPVPKVSATLALATFRWSSLPAQSSSFCTLCAARKS
jgi:hypothetical protein